MHGWDIWTPRNPSVATTSKQSWGMQKKGGGAGEKNALFGVWNQQTCRWLVTWLFTQPAYRLLRSTHLFAQTGRDGGQQKHAGQGSC